MTERDAFELRFHAAIRAYVGRVSSDLDPAELAHEVATAKPRRSGIAAAVLGRSGLAVPRLAWALLLVAGLLAVTVGGMLIAGARPQRTLPAVVPPVLPAFECPAGSSPDAPGPVGQARPPMAFTSAMAFDRRAGRIVTLAPVDGDHAQTWTFDVCTNTWTRMGDGPVFAGSDALVYDADSNLTITVDTGTRRVWAYDLANDTWTAKGLAPMTDAGEGRPRLVYDPVSGNVVQAFHARGAGSPDLWAYDVETDTWTAVAAGGFSGSVLVAYDAAADRLVAYDFEDDGPTTRLVDLRARTWMDAAAVTPEIRLNWFTTGNEITYDEASRRTVILNVGGMIAYDAIADRWAEVIGGLYPRQSSLCPGPRCRWYATTVYDPGNERLVVYGGHYQDMSSTPAVQDDSVLAYDLATRTWSVLLEATSVEPAD
jgi:hypothetical protein